MSLRILIADPRPELRDALELELASAGYESTCAPDARAAGQLAAALKPELCFWGLFDPADRPRIGDLARRMPDVYWVGTAEPHTLEATRAAVIELGLHDLLEDPRCPAALLLVLRRATRSCRARQEQRLLARDLEEAVGARPIVGASPAMIDLLEALENAAGFPAHVLLRGEPGTGKEGLARAIHAQSARRLAPFVRLGVRDGDAARAGAELFGDGAAPGRLVDARGGVLFLDDVEALSLSCQARLLQALEAEELAPEGGGKPHRIDVRVIAASARDLGAAVSSGELRADLHERLSALELVVPPLRERSRDIPLLADHFLARACRRLAKPLRGLSDEALAQLVGYTWPGNVRELENVIERAALLARGDQITPRELPARLESDDPRGGEFALRKGRKRFEAELIRRALRRTGGNRTRAARLLEISHRALLYKLKEYRIED